MTSRKQRRERARVWEQTFGTCSNCGEKGARHFAPPGFGSPGMYICQPKPGTTELTHCPIHDTSLMCIPCAGDHAAGEHPNRDRGDTCARCAKTPPAQIDSAALAAADDSLDSPNDEGA